MWQRYRRPFAITEAHLGCSPDEQMRWLEEMWDAAIDCRAGGGDLRAVTACSLLGAHDWHCLVTRDEGKYEPGAFDLREDPPRPTELADLIRSLAAGRTLGHRALAEPGWWRRPERLLYPPVPHAASCSPNPREAPRRRVVGRRGRRGRLRAVVSDAKLPVGSPLSSSASPVHRDIIVIGASAGGLSALTDVVRGLPDDFPGALFVVVHTSADNPGVLPKILERSGPLPAAFARDGEPIVPGRIYVGSPDHHILIKRGSIRVTRGPKENGFRPAVDPLFRTAALNYGPRVIGVVLSGGLNDGTHGLSQIVEHGGLAIAQDPQEAMIASMPMSAIQNVEVHRVLRAAAIAPALCELVRERVEESAAVTPDYIDSAEVGDSLQVHTPPGPPTPYTCPECGGALWEHDERGKLLRFRCHTGHAFTAEILMAEQDENLDAVLWSALRALEENAKLCHRMAERTERAGLEELARRYRDDAGHGEQRAGVLRRLIQRISLAASTPDAHPLSTAKREQG